MAKEIIIAIKDGGVRIEMRGYEGSDCIAEAERIIAGFRDRGIEVVMERFEPKPQIPQREAAEKGRRLATASRRVAKVRR